MFPLWNSLLFMETNICQNIMLGWHLKFPISLAIMTSHPFSLWRRTDEPLRRCLLDAGLFSCHQVVNTLNWFRISYHWAVTMLRQPGGHAERSEKAQLLFSGQIKSLDERQNVLLPLIKSARSLIYGCTNMFIRRTGCMEWLSVRALALASAIRYLSHILLARKHKRNTESTFWGWSLCPWTASALHMPWHRGEGRWDQCPEAGSCHLIPLPAHLAPPPTQLLPPFFTQMLLRGAEMIGQWMPKDSQPRPAQFSTTPVPRGSLNCCLVIPRPPWRWTEEASTQLEPKCDKNLSGLKAWWVVGVSRHLASATVIEFLVFLDLLSLLPTHTLLNPPLHQPKPYLHCWTPNHFQENGMASFLSQLLLWKQLWMWFDQSILRLSRKFTVKLFSFLLINTFQLKTTISDLRWDKPSSWT